MKIIKTTQKDWQKFLNCPNTKSVELSENHLFQNIPSENIQIDLQYVLVIEKSYCVENIDKNSA